MTDNLWDTAVVGAGAVGLAVGATLARTGRRVVVLERLDSTGSVTSSRNSGVIHAGIYYPSGSLKATSCVEGRHLLYARCARDRVPHRKTGKLIVAVNDEECASLETIATRGKHAGVDSLVMLDRAEVRRREPLLRAVAALWSPESGVVDAHSLMESYRRELLAHEGELVTRTEVTAFERRDTQVRVTTRSSHGEEFTFSVDHVINAGGLWADRVATMAGFKPRQSDERDVKLFWCKGDYFALSSAAPRPNTPLVYPVPQHAGLGIHLTVDLGNRCVAGPDATYVESESYDVDPTKASDFAAAIARYLPGIQPEHLSPDYAGIRPKLQGPSDPFRDFLCQRDGPFVHLIGIESPGLTAAESLARRVVELIEGS